MSDFRDADPEDAWDDGDDFDVKAAILERVVTALRASHGDPRHDGRKVDALRLVAKLALTRMEPERIEALRAALEGS